MSECKYWTAFDLHGMCMVPNKNNPFRKFKYNWLHMMGLNRTRGMVPNTAPTKKGVSSYVSRYAAIRDTIGLPHIDLIGSTSQIHSPNGRTEQYIPTRHTFVSQLESEWSEPPRKRSLASVAMPEKVRVRLPMANIYCSPLFLRAL